MTLDTLSPLTKFLRIGGRRPGSLQAVSRQLCPTSAEPRRGNHKCAIAGAMIATRRTYGLSRLVEPTARWPGMAGGGSLLVAGRSGRFLSGFWRCRELPGYCRLASWTYPRGVCQARGREL